MHFTQVAPVGLSSPHDEKELLKTKSYFVIGSLANYGLKYTI